LDSTRSTIGMLSNDKFTFRGREARHAMRMSRPLSLGRVSAPKKRHHSYDYVMVNGTCLQACAGGGIKMAFGISNKTGRGR
jgi:hypothetical protein